MVPSINNCEDGPLIEPSHLDKETTYHFFGLHKTGTSHLYLLHFRSCPLSAEYIFVILSLSPTYSSTQREIISFGSVPQEQHCVWERAIILSISPIH